MYGCRAGGRRPRGASGAGAIVGTAGERANRRRMFAHCSASSQSALCRLSRQWGTMTSIVPLLGIITCVLLIVRCSAAHSFKQCAVADLRVNCTSVSLSHVPIIFNPRLTQLTLRDTGITQLGQSRPLDVYTRVEYLDLSHNGLANIPDGAFRNQKVLRVSRHCQLPLSRLRVPCPCSSR